MKSRTKKVWFIHLWKSSHKAVGPAGELQTEIYISRAVALARIGRISDRRNLGYETWTRVTGPYKTSVREK